MDETSEPPAPSDGDVTPLAGTPAAGGPLPPALPSFPAPNHGGGRPATVPRDPPGSTPLAEAPAQAAPPVGASTAASGADPGWIPLMPLSMPTGAVTEQQTPVSGSAPPLEPPPVAPFGWVPFDGGPGRSPGPPSPRRPGGRTALVAGALAVALVAGALGAGLGIAFDRNGASSPTSLAPSSNGPVPGLPHSTTTLPVARAHPVSSVAAAVDPGIVDIQTTIATPRGDPAEAAAGTGMIITPSGEVLTNNHVVADATSIEVTVEGHTGTVPAKVLGVDPSQDVALLQIVGLSDLPYVTLGNSSQAYVGDSVIAIGNALGYGGKPSVVTGIVSALGRTITASDAVTTTPSETLHNLIETNAQIQPGDSGGPLLDSRGVVIGMDTAAATSDGSSATLGFAIPINQARGVIERIEQSRTGDGVSLGVSPFLGIIDNETGSIGGLPVFGGSSTATGVTLGGVIAGSPADRAGITVGDVVTAIDDKATRTWAATEAIIAKLKPGDTVSVTFVDATGATHTVSTQLTGLPR